MNVGSGQAFVFAELDFRLFYKRSREGSTFRFGERFGLHVRRGHRNELLFSQSVLHSLIHNDIFRFAGYTFLADVHFQHLARRLALTEAFEADLIGDAGYSLLESLLYLFCGDVDGQCHSVLVQCFYLYVHKYYSSLNRLCR